MFLIDDILIIAAGGAIGGLIGGTVGGLIGWTIGKIIDETSLKNEVKIKYQDALKILIQEKKKNAVNVGIFGEYEKCIEDSVDITSDKGVSDELYVGQEIWLKQ